MVDMQATNTLVHYLRSDMRLLMKGMHYARLGKDSSPPTPHTLLALFLRPLAGCHTLRR